MKRMIPTKFINWVKSLFHRISPGTGDGDIEVGGNVTAESAIFDVWKSKDVIPNLAILTFRNNEGSYELYGYYSLNLIANITCQQLNAGGANISNLKANYFSIGSTALTEDQLKKLIALIPAE